jgi:hypothetical protein
MELRKNAIDVSRLISYIDADRINDLIGDSDNGFVGLDRYGDNAQLLITRGCPWHSDPEYGPLTALLIVDCCGLSIRSWGRGSVVPVSGDVVLFDAHRKHCTGAIGDYPILVAIGVDLPYGSTMDDAIALLKMEVE